MCSGAAITDLPDLLSCHWPSRNRSSSFLMYPRCWVSVPCCVGLWWKGVNKSSWRAWRWSQWKETKRTEFRFVSDTSLPLNMTASLTSGTAVQQAKMALRKAITARLRALPPAQVDSECSFTLSFSTAGSSTDTSAFDRVARTITEHLLQSAYYLSAKNISCYLSLPVGEVQTDQIIRHALANDKKVYIPYCPIEDKTTMRMLRLKGVEHFEGLKENRWGIRELDPSEVSLPFGS